MSTRVPSVRRTAGAALALFLVAATGLSCSDSSHSGTHRAQKAASNGERHLPLRPGRPKPLSFVARTRGPNDPHDFDLSLLIPAGSRLRQAWFIRGGHLPDQVLVEWIRSKSVSLYGDRFPDAVRWA